MNNKLYYFDYAEGLKILREREEKKMAKEKVRLFRNRYEGIKVVSNPGSRIKDTYSLQVNEDGIQEVAKSGQINLYQEIQSHAESVDIHKTLARFIDTGDTSLLNRVQGAYMDITDMPKTYAEFQQKLIDARNMFDSLPVDIRAKFNHNPDEFFTKIGTKEFNDILGIKEEIPFTDVPSVEKVVEEGVVIE